jgi:hypothetical protein
VPGIIFKRFYFQGSFSGQFNSGLFADRIISTLFWGILVQLASALTFSKFINASYQDWRLMLQTLYRNIIDNKLPDTTPDQLVLVMAYAIYCVVLAAFCGSLLYRIVRFLELDLHFPAFRFLNNWHYYFRGEILKTSDFRLTARNKVISTEVDLMLKDNDGKSNLFSGLLTQYTLNSKNELETLYLTATERFSQSSNSMKIIPGDIFIIPFSTVQNMNIRYNYQVRQQRHIVSYAALSLSALILAIGFGYTWMQEISIARKILSTLTLFVSWLAFSSLLISFLPTSNGRHQLSMGAKAVSFSLLLIMLMVSLYILQVFAF